MRNLVLERADSGRLQLSAAFCDPGLPFGFTATVTNRTPCEAKVLTTSSTALSPQLLCSLTRWLKDDIGINLDPRSFHSGARDRGGSIDAGYSGVSRARVGFCAPGHG